MFKLLTEEEKQKVAHEYAARRIIIVLYALILVLVVGIIGLLPSYVLSTARQNEVSEHTKITGNSLLKGDESELKAWLAQINKKLDVLSPKLDTYEPSIFIERILDQKINGIRINGISWTRSEDGLEFSVEGVAVDRQILVAFKDRINDSEDFSSVVLPISDLAQDVDIDFQIKFSTSDISFSTQTPL